MKLPEYPGVYACREATDWLDGQDSFGAAWLACERGDWMAWLLARKPGDNNTSGGADDWGRDRIVRASCAMVRLVVALLPVGSGCAAGAAGLLGQIESWGGTRPDRGRMLAFSEDYRRTLYGLEGAAAVNSRYVFYAVRTAAGCWGWASIPGLVMQAAELDASGGMERGLWRSSALLVSRGCADIIRAEFTYAEVAAAMGVSATSEVDSPLVGRTESEKGGPP